MITWWRRRGLLRRAGMLGASPRVGWGAWLAAPLLGLMSLPGWFIDSCVAAVRVVASPLFEPVVGGARRGRDLRSGLPAVIAFLAVVAVTAIAHLRQTDAAHAYWAAGAERLEAGDAAAAQLLLQKAVSVETDEQDSQSQNMLLTLALAYEQTGDRVRADALMESLAPTESVGHPAAHRYMAIRIADEFLRRKSLAAKAEQDPHPQAGEGAGEGARVKAGESVTRAGLEGPLTPTLSPKANRDGVGGEGGADDAIPFAGEGAGKRSPHPRAGEEVNGELLAEWFWHLSHADAATSVDGDLRVADLQRAWGLYWLVMGEPAKAAEHLRLAAEVYPALWLQVASLEARIGLAKGMASGAEAGSERVRTTLVTARERLEEQFAAEPSNDHYRLLYVTSLYHLDELSRAEQLLEEGMAASQNPALRQLLAAVFVKRYDQRTAEIVVDAEAIPVAEEDAGGFGNTKGTESTEDRDVESAAAFGFLRRALELEPACTLALQRLLALSGSSPAALEESRALMRRLIAAGDASAMAHFTLGSLDWMAGNAEQAALHMRQAMALDGSLPVVANNLAYLIAEDEAGDLEAALGLACQAVESDPSNPSFLDTRARIYERRGELTAAAVDYQRALAYSPRPGRVQQKLAEIYDRLGETALAVEFREAAEASKSAGAE